jgi:hypothetical protein
MTNDFQATQMQHIYCIWVGSEPIQQDLITRFNPIPSTSVILIICESFIFTEETRSLSYTSNTQIKNIWKNLWVLEIGLIHKDKKSLDSQLFIDLNFFRGKKTCSFHSLAPLRSHRPLVTSLITYIQQKLLEYWRNNPTITYLSTRWISNVARNLTYIHNLVNDSEDPWKPPSKPVVLVGAGPGLWSFREDILNMATTHYVLALDTCLPIITQWGIKPDGILIVESQYWNNLDFIPLGNKFFEQYSGDVFLDITTNSQILRSWKNARPRYFLSRFAEATLVHTFCQWITSIPPLGNIGCIGLYLLGLLGFNKATLVGLDFSQSHYESMTRGGHHHTWFLTHCNRFSSLPISKQISQPKDQDYYLTTPIYEREYSILKNLAQRLPIEINYLSEIRPNWKSTQTEQHKPQDIFDGTFFFIDSNQMLTMLINQVKKAQSYIQQQSNNLSSINLIDSSDDRLEYFSTLGSFFTLNVPGSIQLANPDQPGLMNSFITLGIKRTIFEINRGIDRDNHSDFSEQLES